MAVKWLNVPLQAVLLAGVQMTDSFDITLSIPKMCEDPLKNAFVRNKEWLMSKEVDRFDIKGKEIDLTGKCHNYRIKFLH